MSNQAIQQLVNRALEELATGAPLGSILEQCIRIAELRQDYVNLWWLRREAIGVGGSPALKELDVQMKERIPAALFAAYRTAVIEGQISRRQMDVLDLDSEDFETKVFSGSVAEIQAQLEMLEMHLEASKPPPGLAPLDLYYANQSYHKARAQTQPAVRDLKVIQGRIRARLHTFLVETEATAAFGETAATIFERTRAFVDAQLTPIAPDAVEQFKAAYERAEAGHPEALSHALTSCRRVLKSVADALYPATDAVVVGTDGRSRTMSEDKYRNRLWQYVSEHATSDTGRDLAVATLEEVGRRIDVLNELSSKGVHGQVTLDEVDQCILHTYLLVAQLLRLALR